MYKSRAIFGAYFEVIKKSTYTWGNTVLFSKIFLITRELCNVDLEQSHLSVKSQASFVTQLREMATGGLGNGD